MTGNIAVAQENKSATAVAANGEVKQVLVVGTRASQQSAIERKKNAATAMDSIVAEDVGALPDRNVGEAISRLSGVALDRGDFGEGVSVAVRGNSADLTRVEIDGQGVLAGGGTDLNGGGGGRGVELREMSADLIKSVDVVKGATADMTEGSLGGGIIIKTRTGLDFKKPFYSLRVAGSQGSLNKQWSPDTNLILADKFLDNRLGVLLNVSTSQMHNEGHSSEVATSKVAGYARAIDFDNSPAKTFSFNPATVSANDPASTSPIQSIPMTAGGFFNSASPLELVTRSAAAKSKADCHAAFPNLTTAQQNSMAAGNAGRNAAINQRGNELLTCLNQWNDYTPSLVRFLEKSQVDKRRSMDLRLDFKVNNELSVYAKGSLTRRRIDDTFMTYGLGGLNVNTAVALSPTYNGPTFSDATGKRVAVPNSGYYNYDNYTFRTNAFPIEGAVANVVPGSAVVDANHHVTRFSITDGSAGVDQIHNVMETSVRYLQAGGSWKSGPLAAEFLVGDSKADFSRGDKRTSWSYNYGPATLQALPNGLWSYSFPAGSAFDQTNPALYAAARPATVATVAAPLSANNTVALPAYSIAQQPLRTQAPQITWTPKINESSERTAKLDLSYALPEGVPLLTRLKTGFNLRDTGGNSWGAGGYTAATAKGEFGAAGYVPAVHVPSANVRSSFMGCENTAGSLGAGGAPCKYGFNPSSDPRPNTVQSGQTVMTQAQFQDIIAQSMTQPNSLFFNGAKDRPAELIKGWNQIDVEKVFSLVGTPNIDFDCVKECTGSDGKVYQQPVSTFKERTTAGYAMTDFSLDHIPFTGKALPFGMELEGNLGYRVVRTEVKATGMMYFTSIVKTPSFDPAFPNLATGISSSTIGKITALEANTTDYLPIQNYAMWVVPNEVVLRYHRSKAVARPPVTSLLPAGTCTFDERRYSTSTDGDTDQSCSGTIGNPALRAQRNTNQNVSLEWYPNRDTQFSVATFKQVGKVGAATTVGRSDVKLFDGTDLIDPQTGRRLSDLDFNFSTWENGASTTRKGVEFSTRTAFTFLPWHLRNTGIDANYTKLRSAVSSVNIVDLITGDPLPPARESKYSYNWALWYDDGALSARVAVQAVASFFSCIAGCGGNTVNNYPNAAGGRTTITPYNPGSPNFRDATRWVDAKIAYRFKNGIELFAEARNLGRATVSNSQGVYSPFADGTPNLLDIAYTGRRIMVGVNIRSLE
ncbi:TonB-dependent receptor [Pseudoduganella namucuonensis]|uniref:TonB-dependent receptor n=1 Tax=Pseudoduganella namucuonensis TaxID=1035707 RepID=UPI001E5E5999|nr:TonB-dependent receptor [Pseudoduganella namucuonensis]